MEAKRAQRGEERERERGARSKGGSRCCSNVYSRPDAGAMRV